MEAEVVDIETIVFKEHQNHEGDDRGMVESFHKIVPEHLRVENSILLALFVVSCFIS